MGYNIGEHMILTVGSCFSGFGGMDLGLENAGMEIIWQIENEPYAQKVLRKHWPGVDLYDDIKAINTKRLRKVDIIAGGFPCQDISIAGKGTGIEGTRSGLWFEMLRIIEDLSPQICSY